MPKQREKMTEVHSCGSPPFSTCLGAVASFIISQGQKCHKKPFPLVYHQSHKEKSIEQMYATVFCSVNDNAKRFFCIRSLPFTTIYPFFFSNSNDSSGVIFLLSETVLLLTFEILSYHCEIVNNFSHYIVIHT